MTIDQSRPQSTGERTRERLLDGLPVGERRVELAGVSTCVLEGGEGPPLVLLHGPGEHAPKWLRVIPELARDHRVIAPDLPGHGMSELDGDPLDAEDMLAWLGELIERTCAEPPVLVGQILGGAIAARFAIGHGERIARLVLVDALGLAPFEPAPEFGQALGAFFAQPTEETHDGLWNRCAYDLPRLQSRMGAKWDALAAYNVDRARDPGVQAATQSAMGQFAIAAIPADELDRVPVPTTLIWGRHDLATPLSVAEQASERHGWPLLVIEDAADDPPIEQPEAFVRALKTALIALSPRDRGYAEATRLWNGAVERTPALVVRPAGAHEVVAAVEFARERGLAVSARGGGHNIAGTALADGGLTIDMSRMRAVAVDPATRTATVGPGCLLAELDTATQRHGLATPLGFVSEVGVAGLTLGGGLGYLTRRFGWTVDNLLAAEVVTADGQVLRASHDEHADLFWAIRGAGANLGVVTSFTFRLHEVGPTVYGGLIAWPFERAAEIMAAYRSLAETAPRELAVWLNLLRAPAAPFVPEQWHGEWICAMAVCYSGDLAHVDEALAPVRALGDPLVDLLREQPYVELQSYLDATEPKGHHYYWKAEYLSALGDRVLSTCRELVADCPIPDAQLGLLHLEGALNERAPDDGAVGNRDARYALGILGAWEPGTPGCESFPDWVRDAWAKVRPFSTGGSYVNFQTADEDDERVRTAYGVNYDRVAAVKRRYDPGNVFRSNRNVRPA